MDKQAHRDRLTAIDASFLHQEKQASHMHVGALVTFEGPPPAREDFVQHLESRLGLIPRYRQRLAFPPLELGRPFWVDDANFNLHYHVRHTALPRPGSDEQLRELAGRIFSQRLDRSKPLWELWIIQGLERNRFALISKTHHALVDGVSGVDIATVLFDLSPVPPEPEGASTWTPAPEPSDADLAAAGLRGLVRTPFEVAGRAIGALGSPGRSAEQLREAAEGVGEIVWAGLNPAPDVPLNVAIGPHRRVRWVESRLTDFKAIKDALGGTVNDVVLAVVAGALGRWLRSRGVRTEGLELRALVPVSIRSEDEHGSLGNRIAAMRGPLPVYADDPLERLRIVRAGMADLKESKQALGAEVIAGLTGFAPPTLLAQASRLNFSTRLFNLIVTNVPGPQFPLYILGREMESIVPVAFLPENHALAIAIMSYNGKVHFGLLGDYDAMGDLESFGELLEDSLAELGEAASKATAARAPAGNGAGKPAAPRKGGARKAKPAAAPKGD
ncbi:MAG TPA: wax ester/triacylglycerol synthase family O-acyltransferase [Thermoleophilaceae bacterium]|nr:wax ester/triacylglycerol synthase family O-acyltransferase [Thermoleophilaceae bacterium]